ncbi:MAG: SDR family oxidoreductase [Candidatus Falkowbacteria bacterium]
MKFKNKKVLITGAASGIGYAVSKLLVQNGAQVFCFDQKIPRKQIAGVKYFKVDITNSGQIKRALTKVGAPIDILINNAGIMRRGNIFESSEKDFDLLFDINIKGCWLMLKYAKPYLARKATILQMSSRHGLYHPIDPAIYALTKSTVSYLSKILKKTCSKYNVKIAYPGSTDTPLSRYGITGKTLKRKKKEMKSPEFLAEKIVELLKSKKGHLIFDQKKDGYYFE